MTKLMRRVAAVEVGDEYGERLSPPPSAAATCNPHTCTWWPYANSRDFEANAAVIVIILLCALICIVALNAAIRCSLRRNRLAETQRKAAADLQMPTLVFSRGMKLLESECAICLSEFVEGEGIRVLSRCKHGFHVHCIHQWLSRSHTSCPTCRATCLPSPSSSSSSSCHHPHTGVNQDAQTAPDHV